MALVCQQGYPANRRPFEAGIAAAGEHLAQVQSIGNADVAELFRSLQRLGLARGSRDRRRTSYVQRSGIGKPGSCHLFVTRWRP